METTLTAEPSRIIFENAPLGMALTAADGRILDVNPALLDMLGASRDEALRMTVMDITHPDDRAESLRLRRLARDGAIPFCRQEKRLLAKDGRSLHAIERAYALRDETNGVSRWLVLMEDLTDRLQAKAERERLAARLLQAQKMEAVGTLAGGIAHEFNNLLMAIQGSVSLLLFDKTPDHRDFRHLKSIDESVSRAGELTRQLLGFARSGKHDPKPVDVNALVTKTARLFGRLRKELRIRFGLQESLPMANADPGQIEQVVLNLLVNAWQAMPGGGEIGIETAAVTFAAADPAKPPHAAPGGFVRITLTDTGHGMAPEVQARIFEPFYSTREPGRAAGLGLPAACGIVDTHGGFITVESEAGRGSAFRIHLPAAAEAHPPPQEAAPTSAPPPTPASILLVEDEEVVARIAEKMLIRLGHSVRVATSGAQAVSIYREHRERIDLVILDVVMPGMGGSETFERLKAINPEVAVLLSSGYSLNGESRDILQRGCRGFIQKPFSMDALDRHIRQALPVGRGQR
jgi:PAS domain S-box-containing protein